MGWPASAEIDIMETVNSEVLIHGAIHHWSDKNNVYAKGTSYCAYRFNYRAIIVLPTNYLNSYGTQT